MENKVPSWAIILAVVLVVIVIAFIGYRSLRGPVATVTPPPPFIDPVTHRPRSAGTGPAGGSGMPAAGGTGAQTAPVGTGQ